MNKDKDKDKDKKVYDLKSITDKNNTTIVGNFILTGSMSTINGETYSVGFTGQFNPHTINSMTFVNGILISIS